MVQKLWPKRQRRRKRVGPFQSSQFSSLVFLPLWEHSLNFSTQAFTRIFSQDFPLIFMITCTYIFFRKFRFMKTPSEIVSPKCVFGCISRKEPDHKISCFTKCPKQLHFHFCPHFYQFFIASNVSFIPFLVFGQFWQQSYENIT